MEAFALVRGDPSSPTTITGLAPLGTLLLPAPPAAVALVGSGDAARAPLPPLEGNEYKEAVSAVLGAGVIATVFVAVDTRVGWVRRMWFRIPFPLVCPNACIGSKA